MRVKSTILGIALTLVVLAACAGGGNPPTSAPVDRINVKPAVQVPASTSREGGTTPTVVREEPVKAPSTPRLGTVAPPSPTPTSAKTPKPEGGTKVSVETVAQGTHWPSPAGPQFALVTGPESWKRYLQDHGRLADQPDVDWDAEVIMVLLMGQKPTGGYSVAITGVEVQDARVVVHVVERTPPPGAMVIQVLTTPFHVVRVDRNALPQDGFQLMVRVGDTVWEGKVGPLNEDALYVLPSKTG